MGDNTFLIAGLGNPGSQYDGTRHNIGYMVVDELASRFNFNLGIDKWESNSARQRLWGNNICFVKPMTYMNLSGRAIAKFVGFYKLPLERIVVVHDDLDMKTGRLKLVKGGGPGGHNGIRSLIQSLGTRDFYRLKIGIGRPGQGDVHPDFPVEKYVLTQFDSDGLRIIEERYDPIIEGLKCFIQFDAARAMGYLNSFK